MKTSTVIVLSLLGMVPSVPFAYGSLASTTAANSQLLKSLPLFPGLEAKAGAEDDQAAQLIEICRRFFASQMRKVNETPTRRATFARSHSRSTRAAAKPL